MEDKEKLIDLLETCINGKLGQVHPWIKQTAQKLLPSIRTLPAQGSGDGWVSVEDRLPEVGKDVLVCTTGGVMLLPHHTIKNSTTGEIHWLAYGEPYDVKGITHWMPLPEPPTI